MGAWWGGRKVGKRSGRWKLVWTQQEARLGVEGMDSQLKSGSPASCSVAGWLGGVQSALHHRLHPPE